MPAGASFESLPYRSESSPPGRLRVSAEPGAYRHNCLKYHNVGKVHDYSANRSTAAPKSMRYTAQRILSLLICFIGPRASIGSCVSYEMKSEGRADDSARTQVGTGGVIFCAMIGSTQLASCTMQI